MGANTTIEWCDHTFNPVRGCQHAGPGCLNCYAEAMAKRNPKVLGKWGPNGTRVVAAESQWKAVEKWNRDAACFKTFDCSHGDHSDCCPQSIPPSVFCESLGDIFEDWPGALLDSQERVLHVSPSGKWCPDGLGSPVGDAGWRPLTMADVRTRVYRLIDSTQLIYLLLTKRPQNIRRFWPAREQSGTCVQDTELADRRRNVWLGTSIACRSDLENAEDLAKCRELCAGTFWSIEPLIEDLGELFPVCSRCEDGIQDPTTGLVDCEHCDCTGIDLSNSPDQVIIGGESGPHARPCRPEWIRSIARQCEAAGVPCFVKQLGATIVTRNDMVEDAFNGREGWPDPHVEHDIHGFRENYQGADCRVRLRDKKGGDPDEWPEDLRQYRSLAWKGGA